MTASLPPLHPVDLTSASPISAYLKATVAVCPFIEPSSNLGNLYCSEVTPDCQTPRDIHPRLYEQLVPLIERFRDLRRALPEKPQRLLICHIVILRFAPHLDHEAATQLKWPNLLGWTLKQLYTPKEIVLGFVRKHVAENSSFGTPVPVAPFHAVLIRSRVAHSDHRFYPNNDPMLKAMMEADDDGRDVHAPMLGAVPDVRDPDALRDGKCWQRVEQWWKKTLAKK
jgi:hypothetical protein